MYNMTNQLCIDTQEEICHIRTCITKSNYNFECIGHPISNEYNQLDWNWGNSA